jgi:hypothetical protein
MPYCRYVARLGELVLKDDDDGAKPIDVLITDRKVHEEYNPTSFVNDIAILRLQDDVIFTSKFIARCSRWQIFSIYKSLSKSNKVHFKYIKV